MAFTRILAIMWVGLFGAFLPALAAAEPIKVAPVWDRITSTSRTTLSIDVCVYPHIRRGHPLHAKLWKTFSDFEGDYQRILFWYPYPRLVVAELFPPKDGKTFWDFSLIDPIVEDFMNSANGRPVVVDMGTVPNWIYTDTPQPIPDDPNELVWNYYAEKPTTEFFRDWSEWRKPRGPLTERQIQLIADYQARLVGWYTKGGFQDENGKWHKSGHAYKIDYWEVLSEPEIERGIGPEDYTRVYDATVEAVRKVNPDIKFIGLSLGSPRDPKYFFHFLNPANHKPGIPLDMISFHSYNSAASDENDPTKYQHAVFRQVDAYVGLLRYVKEIRDRLSPNTRIAINEVGNFRTDGFNPKLTPIPDDYWNLVAAMSAYHFAMMVDMGIDIVNNAELINYPGQTVGTSLVYWETGEPNARYWALKMLHDSFGPGDKVVESAVVKSWARPPIYSKGYIGTDGKRRVLLINKRGKPAVFEVKGAAGGSVLVVDRATRGEPKPANLDSDEFTLDGFGVAVVTLK